MPVEAHKQAPGTGVLLYGAVSAFVASILLLMSFCSPYWLRSYDIAYDLGFKSMGLWEFCFDNYHYPYQQENVRFSGCDHVYSFSYRAIREWMLPDWLQVVQALMSVSLLLSLVALLDVALMLVKLPLSWWQRYRFEMSALALTCVAVTVFLTMLSVVIFGAKSWDRRWLMYPQYNYFSWAFYLAVLSMVVHAVASGFLLLHSWQMWHIRQVQPRPIPLRSTSRATMLSYQYNFPTAPTVSPTPTTLQAPPISHQAPPITHQAPPITQQAPPMAYHAPPTRHPYASSGSYQPTSSSYGSYRY